MKIQTFIIDAFTDQKFKGNPAGVCLVESVISTEVMQSIASELNLSETAFLMSTNDENTYNIRYFTPTVEVDFCGHASLASAKMILDKKLVNRTEFTTENGLQIKATKEGANIVMDFPLYASQNTNVDQNLLEAFGIENFVEARFCEALDMLLIEVHSKAELEQLNPDFSKAMQVADSIKELVVTVKSEDNQFDFYSRCFCPWIGIDEDPVTGAAHTVLAKFWQEKLGKDAMIAYQLSKRGGYMELEIVDNHTLKVKSKAIIVFEGTIEL